MSSKLALEVSGLSKCFRIYEQPLHRLVEFIMPSKKMGRDFWVLNNISFKVDRGETFGIIGRNGVGKSTLLQLISGTLNQSSGAIKVHGRVAALLELGAGFNPEFTGRENVIMAASIYGLTNQQINDRLDSIFKFAEIGDFVDQPVKTYSSGMYVRLAFAVIANVDAEILIVDEALSVGDVLFQQKCMRFLDEFKARGGTLLFVSHDSAMVMALCDRVLYLRKVEGTHAFVIGAASEVCKLYLRDIYAKRQIVDAVDNKNLIQESPSFNLSAITNDSNRKLKKLSEVPEGALISVSQFNCSSESFGNGGAKIISVEVLGQDSENILNFRTGERVALRIIFKAEKNINKPAVTIILKDRMGQFLYLDGTLDAFNKYQISMNAGEYVKITFDFLFPNLIEGVYSLDVNVTDGSHLEHLNLIWLHDVIDFKVARGRNIAGVSGFSSLKIDWASYE